MLRFRHRRLFCLAGQEEVEGLARLGFPLADVGADGSVHIGKPTGSGGRVDVMTCTEQLIYEMHDPANYITPDCVLDITDVTLHQAGEDRVRVEGMRPKPRTATYKVTVGYFDGWIGEGEVSYAGPDAVARARLSGEIVRERLKLRGFSYHDFRVDLIGMSSLHGALEARPVPYEVRLRVAGRAQDRKAAHAVGFEVGRCTSMVRAAPVAAWTPKYGKCWPSSRCCCHDVTSTRRS